jgi:hypothetical protein
MRNSKLHPTAYSLGFAGHALTTGMLLCFIVKSAQRELSVCAGADACVAVGAAS